MKKTKRQFLFLSLSLSLTEEYMVVCEAHFGKAKFASMLLFFLLRNHCEPAGIPSIPALCWPGQRETTDDYQGR